jgi:uncharacterized repeat protein (TIGR03806 family)
MQLMSSFRLGRFSWLAALPLALFAHAACSDDPSGEPNGADASADGRPPPTPSPYGLDVRPANPTCKAPERPNLDTGVQLTEVFASGVFSQPIEMTMAPGDAETFYIVERPGRVRKAKRGQAPTDFFAFPTGTVNTAGEGGFLGFAFHPEWATKKEAYVSYTNFGGGPANMHSIIARVRSNDGGATLDPSTLQTLIDLEQPYTNHDGGGIHFGPDGLLYIGFGDGGSGGDPLNAGQTTTTLLGKFLRIDVNRTQGALPYGIPSDNPFSGGGGRAEIYALGLRNPWRWSFDKVSGTLWAADVGQGKFEEVDVIKLGGNYGWKVREGKHCYPNDDDRCSKVGMIDPVVEYGRSDGASITGGYVYRGTALPALVGKFIFGDFVTGNIWSVEDDGVNPADKKLLAKAPGSTLAAFGQDAAGEVYALNIANGRVSQLTPAAAVPPSNFPDKLSKTGCVNPSNPKEPASGLIPYDPIAELWSDGAEKHRYMALPDGKTISVKPDGDFEFPRGTVLVKDFDVGGKRVETRLLILHEDGVWAGYSYEWNDAQTDATLLPSDKRRELSGGAVWQYPSRSQCNSCHTEAAGFALGTELLQLNADAVYGATNRLSNQLRTLEHIQVFSAPLGKDPSELPKMSDPFGGDSPELRARSYLHANCSNCHRPGSAGRGDLDLRFTTSFVDTKTCGQKAVTDDLGIPDGKVVEPGKANDSVLLRRMRTLDARRMPPLSSLVVDTRGTQVIEQWINGLASCPQ